jgi:hypothetical protein
MPNSTQKIGETKPHPFTLTLTPAAGERGPEKRVARYESSSAGTSQNRE